MILKRAIKGKNGQLVETEEVEAEEVPLKGWKGFRFFQFKYEDEWYIAEYYTGQTVGWDTTKLGSKRHAREFIARKCGESSPRSKQKLQSYIAEAETINE